MQQRSFLLVYAFKMATSMCTVEVSKSENALGPVIVQFSNGRLRPEAAGEISFELLQNKRGDKLLVADTENMAYKGTSIDGTNPSCKHYIALLDKRRRKVKIVPTQLFWMNPILKGNEQSESDLKDSANNKDKENRQKKADELTMAFGSKKKKRAMESRIRHQVEDTELVSLMQKTANQIEANSVDSLEDTKPSTSVADLLPSVNRNATSLDNVYSIEEIIPAKVMDSLSDEASELANATEHDFLNLASENKYPRFVLDRLGTLNVAEPARCHKAKMLVFMHYLMYTWNLKSHQSRLKDPYPQVIPEPVKQFMFDQFFQSSGVNSRVRRTLPVHLKDKVMGHILVLGLLLDNFQLNLGDLQTAVKCPQSKLQVLVRALGARLETIDEMMWVKLRLPVGQFSEMGGLLKRNRKK